MGAHPLCGHTTASLGMFRNILEWQTWPNVRYKPIHFTFKSPINAKHDRQYYAPQVLVADPRPWELPWFPESDGGWTQRNHVTQGLTINPRY